jgi:hypothetical protein
MKKFYFSVFAVALSTSVYAQVLATVDFEAHLTDPESFDNGSGQAGNFTYDLITLTNNYNVDWQSWSGFAISNITDNTTAGWGNQYASFTGSGHNSETYAVHYPEGDILLNGPGKIDSFFITNTAYAGISMRDGDDFSKQFGSIFGANGLEDGTNGEDFLRLWIICEDQFMNKDSIEFYLADYRFADELDDYIVDEWVKIDLTTLPIETAKVSFRFESSDMGDWGINTPTYFAIDDISHQYYWGLNEDFMEISVFPNPVVDELRIKGESGMVHILDLNGKVLKTFKHHLASSIDFTGFEPGLYILELQNSKGKFTTKILK